MNPPSASRSSRAAPCCRLTSGRPCNAQELSDGDQDIGSGAPLALPNSFGTSAVPHVLVVVGKEGPIYLLNRDDLGGFQQGAPGSCVDGSGNAGDDIGSSFALPGTPGVWATPAMWPGDGGSIYVPNPTFFGAGSAGKLTSYNVVDVGGQPTLSLAGQAGDPFGYGSSSAIVTSDGTSSGSALVWVTFFPVNPGQQQNAELPRVRRQPDRRRPQPARQLADRNRQQVHDAHRPRRPGVRGGAGRRRQRAGVQLRRRRYRGDAGAGARPVDRRCAP